MRHSSCCPLGANRCADPVPRASRTPSRTLTTFTVGFLLLDALLLGYSGLALHRVMLVVWGGVCTVFAVLVVLGWRRYRRVMSELERDRREMRAEAESIRQLLHRKHLQN
jgi:beta-lactamase regulating signal transducer with metallopeptidase domain